MTGDIAAATMYYRFLRVRPPKTNPTPFPFKQPKTAQEAAKLIASLTVKAAAGEIDLGAFEAVVSGLQAFSGALVVSELEQEVSSLREEVSRLIAEHEARA
jgi:hypothetical protein